MKKISLVLVLACAFIQSRAQEKYVIEGKIGNLNPPTVVYLSYAAEDGGMRIDSSKFIGGTFKFSGQVDYVTEGKLVIVHKQAGTRVTSMPGEAMNVYLQNGTTVIN